jgi:hypothetical protein
MILVPETCMKHDDVVGNMDETYLKHDIGA